VAPIGSVLDERALIVVAKNPEIGKVKTRLARALGAAQAFELYKAFLDDIALRFAHGAYDFAFAYTPAEASFDNRGAHSFAQVGSTLNERLHNIFKQNAERYSGGMLIMSSDSPHIPTAWLERGFALLETNGVVLGPTFDGGYWIVGMRDTHDIFTGIPMSTDKVFQHTLARASELALGVGLLPETFDVDTPDDVEKLRVYLRAHADAHLPNTRRMLVEIDARKTVSDQ